MTKRTECGTSVRVVCVSHFSIDLEIVVIAVVKTGGKQYCVEPGNVVKVEKLDVEPESIVSLTDVLFTSPDAGENVVVKAEVLRHVRNSKIIVFKKRRRHNSRRKNGHRQWQTILRITDISAASTELKGE
ncbi:MAG: 50S ribosomal protein L21 [Holosporales bacterium]|nr:50S ribosomal protein L21 [Holosporales bacterium]